MKPKLFPRGMLTAVFLAVFAGTSSLYGSASADYPPPAGGYTYLPTSSETDGRFLALNIAGPGSFAEARTVVWIGVPESFALFEIGIFDGDSGKDANGYPNWKGGNWDTTIVPATFTLYADPLKDGAGSTVVASWNGSDFPNNAWITLEVDTDQSARALSGNFFYRLEITAPLSTPGGVNAFKLRSTGYLSTGLADLSNASLSFIAAAATMGDIEILYPSFMGPTNPGPSTYDGQWIFTFDVSDPGTTVSLWDGEFDHGSSLGVDPDTDDPNTMGRPEWASPFAVPEGHCGSGSPADDNSSAVFRREPAVMYELTSPNGDVFSNDNPSGSDEWEWFSVGADPSVNPDLYAAALPSGLYSLRVVGLDPGNAVFVRVGYEIIDQTPPPVWPTAADPRALGYWMSNFKKIFIQNKPVGLQETRESLEGALLIVARYSALFRHGINCQRPSPITDPLPLTGQEAYGILLGEQGSSKLAAALRQNLAAWLNLGSGKLSPTTAVSFDATGGRFEGTVWSALMQAEQMILYGYGDDVTRAKDIGAALSEGRLND